MEKNGSKKIQGIDNNSEGGRKNNNYDADSIQFEGSKAFDNMMNNEKKPQMNNEKKPQREMEITRNSLKYDVQQKFKNKKKPQREMEITRNSLAVVVKQNNKQNDKQNDIKEDNKEGIKEEDKQSNFTEKELKKFYLNEEDLKDNKKKEVKENKNVQIPQMLIKKSQKSQKSLNKNNGQQNKDNKKENKNKKGNSNSINEIEEMKKNLFFTSKQIKGASNNTLLDNDSAIKVLKDIRNNKNNKKENMNNKNNKKEDKKIIRYSELVLNETLMKKIRNSQYLNDNQIDTFLNKKQINPNDSLIGEIEDIINMNIDFENEPIAINDSKNNSFVQKMREEIMKENNLLYKPNQVQDSDQDISIIVNYNNKGNNKGKLIQKEEKISTKKEKQTVNRIKRTIKNSKKVNVDPEKQASDLLKSILEKQNKTPLLTQAYEATKYYVGNILFGVLTALGAAVGGVSGHVIEKGRIAKERDRLKKIKEFQEKNVAQCMGDIQKTIDELIKNRTALFEQTKELSNNITTCNGNEDKKNEFLNQINDIEEIQNIIKDMMSYYNNITLFNDEINDIKNKVNNFTNNMTKFSEEECDLVSDGFDKLYSEYLDSYRKLVHNFMQKAAQYQYVVKKIGNKNLICGLSWTYTELMVENFQKKMKDIIAGSELCPKDYGVNMTNKILKAYKDCIEQSINNKDNFVGNDLYKDDFMPEGDPLSFYNMKDIETMSKDHLKTTLELMKGDLKRLENNNFLCKLNLKDNSITCDDFKFDPFTQQDKEFIKSKAFAGFEDAEGEECSMLKIADEDFNSPEVQDFIVKKQNEIKDKISKIEQQIEAVDYLEECNQIKDNKQKMQELLENYDEDYNKVLDKLDKNMTELFEEFSKNKTNNNLTMLYNEESENKNNITNELEDFCNTKELINQQKDINNSILAYDNNITQTNKSAPMLCNNSSDEKKNTNLGGLFGGLTGAVTFGGAAGAVRGICYKPKLYYWFDKRRARIYIPLDSKGPISKEDLGKRNVLAIQLNTESEITGILSVGDGDRGKTNYLNLDDNDDGICNRILEIKDSQYVKQILESFLKQARIKCIVDKNLIPGRYKEGGKNSIHSECSSEYNLRSRPDSPRSSSRIS